MFESLTATSVVAATGSWVPGLVPLVLVVIAFVVTLRLVNWGVSKFRAGRGRKRRK